MMTENQTLSADHEKEVEAIASVLSFNDENALEIIRDSVKGLYRGMVSEENDGAMVYLDDTATSLWDEAIKRAFYRWLDNRGSNNQDNSE